MTRFLRSLILGLALLACLHQARADTAKVVAVDVFDDKDAVVDTISVQIDCCCATDVSGKYQVMLIRPLKDGRSLVSVSTPREHTDTVVLFAWIDKDDLLPIFAWDSFRVFGRELDDKSSPKWEGHDATEIDRHTRLRFSTSRASSPLWAFKLPASAAIPGGVELVVKQRPSWQRQFSQYFRFPAGAVAEHKILSSRTPADRHAKVELFNGNVVYSQLVTAASGIAPFYYLPSRPLSSGDSVTLHDLTTSTSHTFGCRGGGPATAFPRVEVRSRSDSNTEPVLLVSAGGAIPFPSPYQTINGTITMPDGEPITFTGSLRNGAVIEWPAHCPLGTVFDIRATAVGSSGSLSLVPSTYTLTRIDAGSVDGIAFAATRTDHACSDDKLEDVGGTLRIPSWHGCNHCGHCRCRWQVVP